MQQFSLWQVLILAVVQGVTEFLPVSSDGHLALVEPLEVELHQASGRRDGRQPDDVAVRTGSARLNPQRRLLTMIMSYLMRCR